MTEKYERIELTITKFDVEDVITTSGINDNPGGSDAVGAPGEDFFPVI